MNCLLKSCALVLSLVALSVGVVGAEVKTRDKGHIKIEGFLGKMIGAFGGKAAKEGVVTTNAVKGDRKAEFTESSGRIVDLKEEKVYEIDLKKKTYTVKTFEQIRKELREAQEKAERDAPKEERPQQEEPSKSEPQKEYEIDFDLKETGQKKQIAGYDTREVVMTVVIREKGKTLEDGGGTVLTTNAWMGPEIAALNELHEFEQRYWKAIDPETAAISAEQLKVIAGMFPGLKTAMERMQKEGVNATGTTLASTMTFETVKSKEQLAQAQEQSQGGGGIGGFLAKKLAKKDDKPRKLVFTVNTETLEVATTVPTTDLEIPAGFKQKQ